MGQLCDFEQIIRHTAHQLAGSMFIKETETQAFNMSKQLRTHICFHVNAHAVTPVSNNIVEERTNDISTDHDHHYNKEGLIFVLREISLHTHLGDIGECQIDSCNEQGTDHIEQEQADMFLIEACEYSNTAGVFVIHISFLLDLSELNLTQH